MELNQQEEFERRVAIATVRVEAARESTLSMMPIEVQRIIQAIPQVPARELLLDQIGFVLEVDLKHRVKPCDVLAGMFLYALKSGHFTDADFDLLTDFRTKLRFSEEYQSRGPFVYTSRGRTDTPG